MQRRTLTPREQWEEDLRQRQRNFVFPDTVRNEGNFYRTLVRGKTPLTGVHRFGLILLAVSFLAGGCIGLAGSISAFLESGDAVSRWLTLVFGGGVSLAMCLFGGLLLFRALLRAPSRQPDRTVRARPMIDVSRRRRRR